MRSTAVGAAYAIAVGLAIFAYLPGLPGAFVYDDHRLILENEGLRRPFDARRAFLRDYYASDADRGGLGYYRPVAILSNELDFRRGGGQPLPFHLTNIAIHAVCAALVVALALRLTGGRAVGGAVAGALFALHPAHAESVAFVSGRVDPLATLFGLGAILLHVRGASSTRPWAWRAGAAATWLVALLSKEIAITVPPLAAALDLAREGRPRRETLPGWIGRYAPFAATAVVYLVLRRLALGALLGAPAAEGMVDIGSVPVVLGSYLAWLLLPPFGIHLEPAPVTGFLAVAAGVLLVAAVSATVWLARRGRGMDAALVAWCVIALLPVAQLRPLETQISERFLYLPSVGACLLLGWTVARAPMPWRRAAIAGVGILSVAYAAGIVPRAVAWRDPAKLWAKKAEEDPGSLKAHLNLGRALAARGDAVGARAAYERAAELHPELADVARGELEVVSAAPGTPGRAEALRRALASTPRDGALWSNLGFELLSQGSDREAADAFRNSVEAVPNRSTAWLGLGLASLRTGNLEVAESAASRAVSLNPDLALARMVLAECALRRGAPCEAIALLDGVAFADPDELSSRDKLLDLARRGCPDSR